MYKISTAHKNKLFTISKILQRSWNTTYHPMVPKRNLMKDNSKTIFKWFKNRNNLFGYKVITCQKNNKILGVCCYYPVKPGLFEIDLLFTAPHLIGNGIGNHILTKVIEKIKEKGASYRLYVGTKNYKAIRFYERFGMKANGKKKFIPWNGFSWIVNEMTEEKRSVFKSVKDIEQFEKRIRENNKRTTKFIVENLNFLFD